MMRRRSSDDINTTNLPEVLSTTTHDDSRQVMWATHFVIVLYALCYWIQIGVMPYLTRKLGVDARMFGYLQSVFALVQLCGGPLYGRFGDLFGGKYALILASTACVSSYGLLAVASSVPVLFLSRLPSVAMHSMQGSQMVVTDITSSEERAAGIGRLGISYGVGMVIGPLLGGYLTDLYNEQTAAVGAMVGSILMIIVVVLFIPSNTKNDSHKKATSEQPGSVFDAGEYINIFRAPNFAYLFIVKAVSSLPIGVFQAMFSIFAMDYFHLSAKENGWVLSYVGVTGMVVQGFGTSYLTKRYTESVLIKYSIVVIAASYLLLMFVRHVTTFVLVLFPLICGGSVFTVIITSLVTKSVTSRDTGAALGISMATNSLIRTVSPTIGGLLYSSFGFPVFGGLGLVINLSLSVYLFLYGRQNLAAE